MKPKVAVVEDDQLSEIYYERENEYTLAGSIYKGRVTRVLPGMQSAFVNIGLERDAFLYVSDFLLEEDEDADAIGEAVASSRNSPIIEVRSAEGINPTRLRRRKLCRRSRQAKKRTKLIKEHPKTLSADDGAPQEQEREGARKWRGRRRRGRGGRDRFAERGSSNRGQHPATVATREKPVEAATEEHSEQLRKNRRNRATSAMKAIRSRAMRAVPTRVTKDGMSRGMRAVTKDAPSPDLNSALNLSCCRVNQFPNTSRRHHSPAPPALHRLQ